MQTFQGLAVSDGLTVGPVVRIDRGAAGLHRIVCDPFRERALYDVAVVLAKDELRRLSQRAKGPDADILLFQIALLEDESFTNEIGDYIAAGAGGAAAVERAEHTADVTFTSTVEPGPGYFQAWSVARLETSVTDLNVTMPLLRFIKVGSSTF